MIHTGLVEVDTGERGWLEYEEKATPVTYFMWFQSQGVDSRVRAYLRKKFEFAVQVKKAPRGRVIPDYGVEWREVSPTDSRATFEAALSQMQAEIGVRTEPLVVE